MSLHPQSKGVPDWVKFALTISLTLASVVYSYATLNQKVFAIEERQVELHREIDALEGRLAVNDASFTEIKVQLAEIQRDILYIKQTLDRHDGG